MNDQNNWEKKLEDLEAEVHQTTPLVVENEVNEPPAEPSPFSSLVWQAQQWLKAMSPPVRIAVIGGGVLILFSILNTILKLATAVVSLAVLLVLIYWGYRLLSNSASKTSNYKKD